jgi:hypothetical protein
MSRDTLLVSHRQGDVALSMRRSVYPRRLRVALPVYASRVCLEYISSMSRVCTRSAHTACQTLYSRACSAPIHTPHARPARKHTHTRARAPAVHCTCVSAVHCTCAPAVHCTCAPAVHCTCVSAVHCTCAPAVHCTCVPAVHCTSTARARLRGLHQAGARPADTALACLQYTLPGVRRRASAPHCVECTL